MVYCLRPLGSLNEAIAASKKGALSHVSLGLIPKPDVARFERCHPLGRPLRAIPVAKSLCNQRWPAVEANLLIRRASRIISRDKSWYNFDGD